MFKPQILMVGLLLGWLCSSGCKSNTTEMPQPPNVKPAQPKKVNPPKAPDNVPQYRSSGVTAPPPGAQFTIFCARVQGDLHVERAKRMRDSLVASTGMKEWYVISEEGQSLLYYGYYRAVNDPNDPKESARAKTDRQKIDLMRDDMGNRPFKQALFLELSAPDPVAPPEWNLLNAGGTYTLQIAVYKGSPQRKEYAVEAVRAARAQGIPAYYYHGESVSLVCVGAWPATAIEFKNEQTSLISGGSGSSVSADPFAPQGNLQMTRQDSKIVDPTLEEARRQYPENSVNGMRMRRMVGGKEQFDPSLVLRIPERSQQTAIQQQLEPQGLTPTPAYDAKNRPQIPSQLDPPPQPQPGTGQLRSIGGAGR